MSDLRPVAEFRGAVPDGLVETLELLLEEAKAGKVLGLIVVASQLEGCTGSTILIGPESSITGLLGELEATKFRFMREHVEGCE